MFDINAIVNTAISEAVNARITTLLQEHANVVGAMAERIAELETKLNALDAVVLHHTKAASPDDVLNREDVADIVRELWSDEFDSEIDDKVERAIDDIDLSDAVRREIRDLSFSITVE